MTDEQKAAEMANIIAGRSQRCPQCQLYHQTARTNYQSDYPGVDLYTLDGVENFMSKEELNELNNKMRTLMDNLAGISDVQTRALMEQSFKRGYLAAHVSYTHAVL